MNGVDSYATPDYAAVRAAGRRFVCRYLGGGNPLTAGEVADARNAAVPLVSIWEQTAQAALGGAGTGTIDARDALVKAAILHQPKGSAIYCTVDFDPTTAELSEVRAYVRAFSTSVRSDGYTSGLYGGVRTLRACKGSTDFTWQAAGWSYGDLIGSNLRQLLSQITIGGTLFDQDEALTADFGAWTPAGVWPPAPRPIPKPLPPEVDVKIHPLTIQIEANGEGTLRTSFRPGTVASLVPEFGLGPKPAGSLGIAPGSSPVLVTAKGWPAGSLSILVGVI